MAMLTNWVLCYLLVPISGASGAAIANAISFTVFFALRTEISARIWRGFERKELYCIATITVCCVIGNAFFAEILEPFLASGWALIFIFLIYYFNDSLRGIKAAIKG